MVQHVAGVIVKSIRLVFPEKVYKKIRNIYRILNLDYAQFSKFIELAENTSKRLELSKDEFERHKNRSIIVDGKLNYLLYGKVADKVGTVDHKLVMPNRTQDEMDFNIDFTVFLRGDAKDLKRRYLSRITNLINSKVIDGAFMRDKTYIDLGAGNGNVTAAFQEAFKFSKITGVDSYNNHFEIEELFKQDYVSTDVVSFLTFTDKKAYFISAVHLLEHLTLNDQYYFLKKCYDMLEYGGYLYIEMPNIYNYKTLTDSFWADEQHLRPFPMSAFRVLIQKLGFEPFYGVYDAENKFIRLDDYIASQQYFDNKYVDLFLSLRKL